MNKCKNTRKKEDKDLRKKYNSSNRETGIIQKTYKKIYKSKHKIEMKITRNGIISKP